MMQESFSRLWEGYETDKAALTARNARLRELRSQGVKCRGFTLTNQLRKYAGLGQPDGRVCNVYYVSVDTEGGVE